MININLAKQKVIFIGIQYTWNKSKKFILVNHLASMSTITYNEQKHIMVNREEYENSI